MKTLVERLREESERLSGRSLDRGCQDSGIAANLAEEARDYIEKLEAALWDAQISLDPAWLPHPIPASSAALIKAES